ncbi:MAG: hypothetical protein ACE5FZ_06690 [Nitrospiria bacterium]
MPKNKFSKAQAVGLQGEQWVFKQLQNQGYSPWFVPHFHAKAQDIIVDGLPIEVKFANPTYRVKRNQAGLDVYYPRWQWLIHPTSHEQNDEWCLILVAQDEEEERWPFILPGSQVNKRNHLQLTSHPTRYRGWMAQYLNRWEMIEYLSRRIYQAGGPLFQEWGVAA